jgi:hypothetical protein
MLLNIRKRFFIGNHIFETAFILSYYGDEILRPLNYGTAFIGNQSFTKTTLNVTYNNNVIHIDIIFTIFISLLNINYFFNISDSSLINGG